MLTKSSAAVHVRLNTVCLQWYQSGWKSHSIDGSRLAIPHFVHLQIHRHCHLLIEKHSSLPSRISCASWVGVPTRFASFCSRRWILFSKKHAWPGGHNASYQQHSPLRDVSHRKQTFQLKVIGCIIHMQ